MQPPHLLPRDNRWYDWDLCSMCYEHDNGTYTCKQQHSHFKYSSTFRFQYQTFNIFTQLLHQNYIHSFQLKLQSQRRTATSVIKTVWAA